MAFFAFTIALPSGNHQSRIHILHAYCTTNFPLVVLPVLSLEPLLCVLTL